MASRNNPTTSFDHYQNGQSLIRKALYYIQVYDDGLDVPAERYLTAMFAWALTLIATSACTNLPVMAVFLYYRRNGRYVYHLTYIIKLSFYIRQVAPAIATELLMQSSTTSGTFSISLMCPLMARLPTGL